METKLKSWRIAAGLKLNEVSKRAGVTESMWSRWENGVRPIPAERVLSIEEVTGISRHDLRPDVYGPSPQEQDA